MEQADRKRVLVCQANKLEAAQPVRRDLQVGGLLLWAGVARILRPVAVEAISLAAHHADGRSLYAPRVVSFIHVDGLAKPLVGRPCAAQRIAEDPGKVALVLPPRQLVDLAVVAPVAALTPSKNKSR